MSAKTKSIIIVVLVLFFDQALKIWIKTHMMLGDDLLLQRTGLSSILSRTMGWLLGLSLATVLENTS